LVLAGFEAKWLVLNHAVAGFEILVWQEAVALDDHEPSFIPKKDARDHYHCDHYP
jgi:hypothetical protein